MGKVNKKERRILKNCTIKKQLKIERKVRRVKTDVTISYYFNIYRNKSRRLRISER
jgi:hypothetical protein